MKKLLRGFTVALGVMNAVPAQASPISLNLGSYAVAAAYALDREIAGLPPIAD